MCVCVLKVHVIGINIQQWHHRVCCKANTYNLYCCFWEPRRSWKPKGYEQYLPSVWYPRSKETCSGQRMLLHSRFLCQRKEGKITTYVKAIWWKDNKMISKVSSRIESSREEIIRKMLKSKLAPALAMGLDKRHSHLHSWIHLLEMKVNNISYT